ncbi:MAG: branched-chain amino acid ABC transporter permease [Firmicutes bacterium]|nr:branched-chain amino acid ABC transporter permease [Bacillota bacterium]
MSLSIVIEFIINVLSMGSLYALIALGLVIVYGICKLINFAYGEYITAAAYLLVFCAGLSLPWWVAFVLAILGGALIGFLSELIAYRPFRGRSLDALLVTSFGISIILQRVFQVFISPRPKAVNLPAFMSATISLFGITTPLRNIIVIITTAVLLLVLLYIMQKTPLGIAMRAAAENFTTARLMGVNANLVISTAFIISGFLAGFVCLFWVARTGSVEPTLGASPLLIGFIAVVVGGMNSLPGAVVGGYLYALVANVLSLALPTSLLSYRDAIMFVIVICFLVLKPEGLIRGNYQEERVG